MHRAAAASPACFLALLAPPCLMCLPTSHVAPAQIALHDWQQQPWLATPPGHSLCEAGRSCTLQRQCHRTLDNLGQHATLSIGMGQKEEEPDKLRSVDKVQQGARVCRAISKAPESTETTTPSGSNGTNRAGPRQSTPRLMIQLTQHALSAALGRMNAARQAVLIVPPNASQHPNMCTYNF